MRQNHAVIAAVPAPRSLIAAVEVGHPVLRGLPWQPLSGGRSNQLWQVGDWVIKLYDPAAASPLFPNDPLAEARALRLIAPLGLAPVLRATGANWLAYDHHPGGIWIRDPAPVAEALARIHRIDSAGAGFRQIGSGRTALIADALRVARGLRSPLPPLPDTADLPPLRQPCLLHADAVPGNIIVNGPALTLIDWQCPALGDPAEDLAAFLSPAMQWLYRGAPLAPDEAAAFLAAYPDHDTVARYRRLEPLYHWRMAAHCLWKTENGASDYAAALQLELAAL